MTEFHLRWQSSIAEYEQALAAAGKVHRSVPIMRITGALIAASGVYVLIYGQVFNGPVFIVFGTALVAEVPERLFRRLVVYPRNRALYGDEWDVTVDSDGIVNVAGSTRHDTAWAFWKWWFPTPSGLALVTGFKTQDAMFFLSRRGLTTDQEWAALVEFVAARVPRATRAGGRGKRAAP